MNLKAITAILVIIVTSSAIFAQTEDYGVWSSIGIEKKINKWDFNTGVELRTKNNAQQMDRLNVKLESAYRFFSMFQAGAGYEFIYYHDTRYLDYQPRHRGYGFIQGKYKAGRFTFSLRERAQVTKKDDSDRIKSSGKINTYRINPEWTWRNRFKVLYNIPKFPVNPSFSIESFYQLNDPDGNTFYKMRYTLAFNYNLTKHHQFELFGLLNKEINVTNPNTAYITGVGYVFSF